MVSLQKYSNIAQFKTSPAVLIVVVAMLLLQFESVVLCDHPKYEGYSQIHRL